jgi:hypothetical protein
MGMIVTQYQQTGKLLCGAGNWLTTPVKMALLDNTYTVDAAHTQWSQASASEVTDGDGYSSGGQAITASIDNAALKSGSVTFSAPTKSCRSAIIYFADTVDTVVNPLLWHILLDDTPGNLIIDFTLTWNGSNLCLISEGSA